ncbi:MCE family protein [Antrihabitans sp. YC2-6]|uniref:MCE family protein n=1 Tax=Antrihabitans sp. YC2-6 TaxID=2799498 RepID=UPI0018F6593E|nr:MCE family protein [Antrihabitans sp. YC2-6]MBJ8343888.1 MCE family protein [Antrihabitans sp. YC2-6]
MTMSRKTVTLVSTAGVLALLAVLAYVVVPKLTSRTVVGYFPAAVGLFPGDEVRILGVDVGSVERIEPEGTRVAVHMRMDKKWELPADVQAVLIAPTLVTTRFVQLTPAYTGGPTLPDGGTIPEDRTAVPVEWDKIKEQLTRLTDTLGPQSDDGDATGTLAEFVTKAADNARGNGSTLHETLANLAQATTALSDGRTDLFSMVRDLSVLVDALSQSHQQIVAFNDHLASVTEVFAASETSIGDAVADLDLAVTDIEQFVRDNKDALGATVDKLGTATQSLADNRRDLEQVLHVGPTALVNLYDIYQPAQNSLTGAPALANFANPVQFICSAIAAAGEQGAQEATDLCVQYLGPVLKTLAFNYVPIGAVVGNSVGATPDQIEYSEPGLAAPVRTGGDSQLRIPPALPSVPGLPGLLLPGLPEVGAR